MLMSASPYNYIDDKIRFVGLRMHFTPAGDSNKEEKGKNYPEDRVAKCHQFHNKRK